MDCVECKFRALRECLSLRRMAGTRQCCWKIDCTAVSVPFAVRWIRCLSATGATPITLAGANHERQAAVHKTLRTADTKTNRRLPIACQSAAGWLGTPAPAADRSICRASRATEAAVAVLAAAAAPASGGSSSGDSRRRADPVLAKGLTAAACDASPWNWRFCLGHCAGPGVSGVCRRPCWPTADQRAVRRRGPCACWRLTCRAAARWPP